MAEYRSGNDAAAEETLPAATEADSSNPYIAQTAAFYRAMLLFRQRKIDKARSVALAAAAGMRPLPSEDQTTMGVYKGELIIWLAYTEAWKLLDVG